MSTFAPMKFLAYIKESYSGLSKEVWLLSLVMLVNRAGSMVIPYLSLYLNHEKHFNLEDAGYILSFYGIGSLIGTYFGGWLTDRYNPKWIMVASLISSGIAFILLKELDGFWILCLGLMVTIALADIFRPVNLVSIATYSKPENRTRAIGLNRLAVNLGYAIGPAVGGIIVYSIGYDWLFILDGLTCILAGVLLLLTLPDRAAKINRAAFEESKILRDKLPTDWAYLWFMLLVCIVGVVFMQWFNTVPLYLTNKLELNEPYYGKLVSFSCILIVLIEMPILQAMQNRNYHAIILGGIILAMAYPAFLFGYHVIYAWISITLITFGEIFCFPFLNAVSLNRAPVYARGRYMGQFSLAFSVSHILAPIVGLSIVARFGYDVLWITMGFLMLLFIGGFIALWPILERTKPLVVET